MWATKIAIYFIGMIFSLFIGLIHFKKMNKASKYIYWYILTTFIFEGAAIGSAFWFRTNIAIYNAYTLFQYTIITFYFINIVNALRNKHIGLILYITGILWWIVNSIFLQPFNTMMNTNFLVFESMGIVAFALYYFYEILTASNIHLELGEHFWISSLLLIFWSVTFFYWLIGIAFYDSMKIKPEWMNHTIYIVSTITYTCFGVVFLIFNRKKQLN